MSLEALTYTPDATPIPRDDFVRTAADAGWILCPVHDIFEPARFHPVSGGVVTDGDYFYGWRSNDRHRAEYEQVLGARQVKQMEAWAQEAPDSELGAAFAYAHPYQHKYSADQEAELAAETSPDYLSALRAAKLEYLVDLRANNDDFRLDLARLICRMRGGLWVGITSAATGEWNRPNERPKLTGAATWFSELQRLAGGPGSLALAFGHAGCNW